MDFFNLTGFEQDSYLFCLLWFFYTTSAEFGFMHLDLKSQNIMVKKYDKPIAHTFNLKDRVYQFTTDSVPVPIDFDLGRVFITGEKLGGASRTHTPPEVLLKVFYYIEESDFTGYDWWSIGIIMMNWIFDYEFDEAEIEYFGNLAEAKPKLEKFHTPSEGKNNFFDDDNGMGALEDEYQPQRGYRGNR